MTTAPRPLGHAFGREPSAVGEAPRAALADDAPADRFHNREDPSASEMAEMLREVQDTLAALDGRLDGLEGAQGDSSLVTRRLAAGVAEMGEALARRMRSLEGREGTPGPAATAERAPAPPASRPAPPPPPESRLALSLGMAAALGLALVGFWLFGRGEAPRARPVPPAPRAAPPVVTPAPAPVVATRPSVQKAAATRPTFAPRRRPAAPRATSPEPGPPAAGYRSFGPAVTTSSPPKPAAANTTPKPPS